MMLVLGACAAEPGQDSATTTTQAHAESTVSDQPNTEGRTVDNTVPAETTPGAAVSSQTASTTTLPSVSSTAAVNGGDTGSVSERSVLPEPGDGLDHPKTPNTSMIVPPPID